MMRFLLRLCCVATCIAASGAGPAGGLDRPRFAGHPGPAAADASETTSAHEHNALEPDPPLEGVLVLRNGEVFEGQIFCQGNSYVVTLANCRIFVPEKDVDFCCRTLHDAYECKRAVVDPQSAEARLALAEWCLRHTLLDAAEDELRAARQLNPRAPRLELIERRLELARTGTPSRPASQSKPQPSENLDRSLSGLPPHVLEVFTQRIQPLLLNRCGTAGCHGPQSQAQFKLLRQGADKPASRRITQRNLLAATEFVDWTDWQTSPLLAHAARRHGRCKAAPLGGVQSKQYRELAEWVRQLAGGTAPAASNEENMPLAETTPDASGQPQDAPPEPQDVPELEAALLNGEP